MIYELTKDGLWEVSGTFPIFMNLYSLKTFEIFKIFDGSSEYMISKNSDIGW